MDRLVLDTNVWVSNFLVSGGKPAAIVSGIENKKYLSIISDFILDELAVVLSRERLVRRYKIKPEDLSIYLSLIIRMSEKVTPTEAEVAMRDPRDIPIIGTALAGRATHLITGDYDFLDDQNLRAWMRLRGVSIVSPADFFV